MTSGKLEVFGGARCAKVASFLGKQSGRRIWIFSVCSDERLPTELEQRLRQIHVAELPSHIVIVGDFSSVPPERSPASFEAIRLIAEAASFQGVIQVCWIDGELLESLVESSGSLVWHEFPFDRQRRKTHVWPTVHPSTALEREACAEITQLLGRQPGVQLSVDGSVEALNLTDGEDYRRSLVAGLSKEMVGQIWALVKCLSGLRELKAGFSGLRAIPDLSELKFLECLDLRGNPSINLDQLRKISTLRKLNVAACELDDVPLGIAGMPFLETLLLHKNRIRNVLGIEFPPLLQRLSLYRNRIESDFFDLSKCSRLKELNLGANPLEHMVVKISDEVNSLCLRTRHVKGDVRFLWRGRLGINPAFIYDS